jgi:hypothetical protein
MESPSLADDLLKGAEAIGAYINLAPRQVYHLHQTEQIPTFQKGAIIFARKSELDASFRSEANPGRLKKPRTDRAA